MKMSLAVLVLVSSSASLAFADDKPPPEPTPAMEPQKVGPRTEQIDEKAYAKVLRVAASGADHATIAAALAAVTDAAEGKRYAILVATGQYKGETVAMKPFVDLFGGYDQKDWKQRDI